jgi:hypothetical protein
VLFFLASGERDGVETGSILWQVSGDEISPAYDPWPWTEQPFCIWNLWWDLCLLNTISFSHHMMVCEDMKSMHGVTAKSPMIG